MLYHDADLTTAFQQPTDQEVLKNEGPLRNGSG